MQWPAVFLPCAAQEPVPVTSGMGGLDVFARHPGRRDRRPGPVPRHSRGRDAAVLRRRDPGAEVPVRDVLAGRGQPAAAGPLGLLRPHAPRSSGCRPTLGADQRATGSTPQPVHETPQVTLSFSELKYLFECPYQFKLRFLYGFNPPLHEALGYGKGLHDALSEIHKRALDGDIVTKAAAADSRRPAPATRRSRTPRCASSCGTRPSRRSSATSTTHGNELANTEFTARSRSRSTSRRASPSTAASTSSAAWTPTRWRSSTSSPPTAPRPRTSPATNSTSTPSATRSSPASRADLIEVLNLDEKGKTIREEVDDPLLVGVRRRSATPATRCGRTTFRVWPHGTSSAASATSPSCVATSLHWTRRRDARLPAAKAASQMRWRWPADESSIASDAAAPARRAERRASWRSLC